MKRGAIAFFDALGFRGIWRRHDPDRVLEKLRGVQQEGTAGVTELDRLLRLMTDGEDVKTSVGVTMLSDTIIVTATVDGGRLSQEERDCTSLFIASNAVSALTALAARDAPPLAYRGCVSLGEFDISESFVVGPAVDDAASNEALAEAAIVWLTPSAETILRSTMMPTGRPAAENAIWVPWQIPLKNGSTYVSHGVNPFLSVGLRGQNGSIRYSADHAPGLRDNILGSFDESRLDIAIKKQNTQRFLDAALATATAELTRWQKDQH